jgi:glycosyltransferase involved in cell wall biosynthesis
MFGIPVVLHLNGGDLVSLPDIGFGGVQLPRRRALLLAAAAAASQVTTPSRAMQRLACGFGIKAERVPLGVALDRWPPVLPRPREAGPAKLLSVGSLNLVKDHATLLHAVARLQGSGYAIELDIVGEDTLRGQVHALVRELGLEGIVKFHGFLTHERLRPLFSRATALVVSSRHEADPIVALEAAVAGVPVVGTAVGHLLDWAPHAALTVAPRDADALARTIARVIDDEALRLSLAHSAQRIALAENADWTAAQFLSIYDGLRTAGRRAPSLSA